MSIDREAALKRAEKLLRQGKLDGAIQEYVRLVEDQPRDWNAINALGDLYVRAGEFDKAVAQFTRIADHLFDEGFLPRAAALYKKALKVRSDHEHTLVRLGEIAARQGLLADAKAYLRQLADQRRSRGDDRGAAQCLIRLGTFDEADAEAKMAASRAALQLGDTPMAAALLKSAAADLEKQNRPAEALAVWLDAAQLDPADNALRARLARECSKAGQLERARALLTAEIAGDDPDLLLALARIELSSGDDHRARAVLTRLVAVAPDRHADVVRLAHELAAEGRVDSAFGCVDVATDGALLGGDWDRAVDTLQAFVREAPHVPALIKLVEVCVDTGLDAPLREAQAQLADAYIRAGRGAEAKVIAEDLLDQDRGSASYARLLRSALELLGVENPERAVAERVSPEPEPIMIPMAGESLVPEDVAHQGVLGADILNWSASPAADLKAAPAPEPLAADEVEPSVAANRTEPMPAGALEVDLTDALAEIGGKGAPPAPAAETPRRPQELESVFDDIRARVVREQQTSDASARYECGLAHLREGRVTEAIAELQAAARVPLLRFKAAAELGRLYTARGELVAATDWLERAAEAPAPTREEGLSVLYDLAGTLERLGETARALAVLIELGADAGDYRDIQGRIERLARAQAGIEP